MEHPARICNEKFLRATWGLTMGNQKNIQPQSSSSQWRISADNVQDKD